MNQLTYALLGVGVSIIALVALFNWWQERKIQKTVHPSLNQEDQDLLMTSDHTGERVFGGSEDISPGSEEDLMAQDEVDFQIAIENENDIPEETAFDNTDPLSDHITIENTVLLSEEPSELSNEAADNQVLEMEPLGINANTFKEVQSDDSKLKKSKLIPEDVSEEVDLIATFSTPDLIKFESLTGMIDRFNRLDKAVLSFGLDQNNKWHALGYASQDLELIQAVFSLQLADRSGPVTQETLLQFQEIIQDISAILKVEAEWLGSKDPLTYAQSLDAFCLEVDKTMHLHLVSGSAGRFTGTKFRGLAEASGLLLNANGEFQSFAPSGQVNFVLANMENNVFSHEMLKTSLIKGISFSLDIPRADHCAEAFNQMLLIAKKMQHSLSASLTDDRKKELSDHQIEKIRQQLKLIQTHMATRGIPSGSPIALRLFS